VTVGADDFALGDLSYDYFEGAARQIGDGTSLGGWIKMIEVHALRRETPTTIQAGNILELVDPLLSSFSIPCVALLDLLKIAPSPLFESNYLWIYGNAAGSPLPSVSRVLGAPSGGGGGTSHQSSSS
jgi:hypothetical protein